LFQEGKDVIKEIPLSRFELPLHIIITAAAGLLFFLDRLQIVPQATGTAVIVTLVFMWGFYAIKWLFFVPRGRKVIIMRAFKNSGIQLSVEKLKHDKLVHFDRNDDVPPTHVERMNKHFEVHTGRPFVIAMEEKSKNINLFKEFEEDKEAKEFNNIIKTTWGTAWQSCLNNMLMFRNKIKDPMFIITILVLFAVVALILLTMGNAATNAQIAETLNSVAEATGAVAEA